MNRWKTKKKSKDAETGVRGPSSDSDPPSMPVLKTSKSFMFGRKTQEPEVKPQIDLQNALPSTDDFRTSLLMSGLSARFSMLREQDDPKSKIGKASDDSVLFPKRQSRLNDFGFLSNGLSDIAEVSSIHGSIRPPFAVGRTDSYHEGYGTDDEPGSIMDRKKPTDGNNLFGGRQKIYKIPASGAGSMKSLDGSGSGGMSGRALYDDDVSLSAFQKLKERERQQQQHFEQSDEGEQDDEPPSRSNSQTGYNRNRETSSTTTTSSLTRSSTAATSVNSQRTPSLNGNHSTISPVIAKTRRLYEQGLDQQLHEQQHSAMTRLDSISRQRNLGAHTPPPGITSPVMVNDKWDRPLMAGKHSMPNLRAASPPPTITPIGTFDFGIKATPSSSTKPYGVSSPPLSPPMSDAGDVPLLEVQPNDRGKATAMGAFSKPAQAYDETKYSQKQIQMQQGRETPTTRKQSPPRVLTGRPLQQPQMPRNRADSNATFASGRSRSSSSAQRSPYTFDRIPESTFVSHQESVPEDSVISSSTFPDSVDHSPSITPIDSKLEQSRGPVDLSRLRQLSGSIRPPESQHPAHRQDPFAQTTQQPEINIYKPKDLGIVTSSSTSDLSSFKVDNVNNLSPSAVEPPSDSPTLGPTTGLSNIRQHLRTDSNSSSIYSAVPSAGLTSRFPNHVEPVQQMEYSSKGNAWEDSEWDRGYNGDEMKNESSTTVPKAAEDDSSPVTGHANNAEIYNQKEPKSSWEEEIQPNHNRTGSTATQKEQQEFQDELASRRRQIKENLKSFVETESRSASPTPGQDRDYNPMKHPALGLLKNKTSRGSLAGKPKDHTQSKAMKMLGLNGSNSPNPVSPIRQQNEENLWKHEEDEMLQGIPKPSSTTPPQMKAFRQARREAQRDRERQIAQRHQPPQQRMHNDSFNPHGNVDSRAHPRMRGNDRFPPNIRTGPRDPSRDRRPPPVAYTQREDFPQDRSRAPSRTSRERSGSDASLRSKSRNGRYKDDLAKAMAEGISTSNPAYDELAVPVNRFGPRSPGTPNSFNPSPIPSPMVSAPRSRSNSVMSPNGYFEPPQQFPMLQPNSESDYPPPRPSPAFSVNSTPSLVQPSPAPSAMNTPTSQVFQSQSQPKAPPIAARKRSINKSDISEPKLISSTSRITTVDLPPGSSLQNGMEPHTAPPIPPVNPRRRQTRTMFGFSKKGEFDDLHSLPQATQSTDEMSTFSADEGEKPKARQKLRKSSSEGGNLNARARQAAFAAPSPALPTSPFPPPAMNNGNSPPRPTVEGGMF